MQNEGTGAGSSVPGTWYGRTWSGHLAATNLPISEPSSKKRRRLRTRPPLYLNLQKESGLPADASWETDGQSLTEFSTLSFGECPSVVVESRLSQILEDTPHPKYSLSAKACAGILNRASRRGKPLPPELEAALILQSRLE